MKIRFIVPVVLGTAAVISPKAQADTRDDILAAIQRCGVIHDNKVWLDCAYGAIQPMRAQLGLQPAPEFQQRLVPPPQMAIAPAPPAAAAPPARVASRPAVRKRHGFFDNLLSSPSVTVSKMTSYRYEKNGAFVIALDNGEQWRQIDATAGSVSWNKAPANYTVTVTEGAFGTYSLRTSDSPNIYKVELVK